MADRCHAEVSEVLGADVRPVLAGVKVPTLVLHRANTAHNLDEARRSSEKPAVQRSK